MYVVKLDGGGSYEFASIREAYEALRVWDYRTEDGLDFWRVQCPEGTVTRAWIEAA